MRKRKATAAERAHLDAVAQLPCLICGAWPVELHHLRTGQGMGQRASHFEVLPLCPYHHRYGGFGVAIHGGTQEFQRNYGSETELLARVLALLEAAS